MLVDSVGLGATNTHRLMPFRSMRMGASKLPMQGQNIKVRDSLVTHAIDLHFWAKQLFEWHPRTSFADGFLTPPTWNNGNVLDRVPDLDRGSTTGRVVS